MSIRLCPPARLPRSAAKSLGCIVNPKPNPLTYSNPCGESAPPDGSHHFQVTFRVLNGSGSYSYAW